MTLCSLNYFRFYDSAIGAYIEADPIGILQGDNHLYVYVGSNPLYWYDLSGLARKKGKTPPTKWPDPPEKACGKKPKWNPAGYWDGKDGWRGTWDDKNHGTGADRGKGPQDGHWDDENSDNRWDRNGNLLPGSPGLKSDGMPLWPFLIPLGGGGGNGPVTSPTRPLLSPY